MCSVIPPGLEPDRWEGRTHVSLVALEMHDIRLRGWRIPGFGSHAQVNFRTYVRHPAGPGVSFVREFVPSRLVAAVGRLRYGEPVRAARIVAHVEATGDTVRAEYRFGLTTPSYHVAVTGSAASHLPSAGGFEQYLTERTVGCRVDHHNRPQVFRVAHPPWAVREIRTVGYDVDFAALYGAEWSVLNGRQPVSVLFAVGSEVSVFPPVPDAHA